MGNVSVFTISLAPYVVVSVVVVVYSGGGLEVAVVL